MKVQIHRLFQYLLDITGEVPEAFIGFSLSQSPKLRDFLADLDPDLSLDWNGASFLGLPALRDHILSQAGLTLPPEAVLVTAGAAEANYLALRQILNPGDAIVTETPGWPQAAVLARAIGADLRLVPRRAESHWRLDPDDIARAMTNQTRLIFLSNPNNPTGQLLSPDDLARIIAIADHYGAWLLVDEVYAGLEWTAPRPPSIAGLYPRGITTGSVSKALGLQGIRTGWLICPDPGLIHDAMVLRENASEIMNILGEHIAEIALRPARLQEAMTQARRDGAANLAQLDAFITAEPRLSWTAPQAGLIGLARLDGPAAESFARTLLAPPYRTFVLPGSTYDQPQHLRLGVGGGAAANLALGLTRLHTALAAI